MRLVAEMRLRSINHRTMPIRMKTGKLIQILDPKYRKCLDDLTLIFRPQVPGWFKPFAQWIEIRGTVKTSKDLDNVIKVIIDAVKEAGIITDDKFVNLIHLRKMHIKRSLPDVIDIEITGMPEEELFDPPL